MKFQYNLKAIYLTEGTINGFQQYYKLQFTYVVINVILVFSSDLVLVDFGFGFREIFVLKQ